MLRNGVAQFLVESPVAKGVQHPPAAGVPHKRVGGLQLLPAGGAPDSIQPIGRANEVGFTRRVHGQQRGIAQQKSARQVGVGLVEAQRRLVGPQDFGRREQGAAVGGQNRVAIGPAAEAPSFAHAQHLAGQIKQHHHLRAHVGIGHGEIERKNQRP